MSNLANLTDDTIAFVVVNIEEDLGSNDDVSSSIVSSAIGTHALMGMGYAYDGFPAAWVPGTSSIDTLGLSYALDAKPLVVDSFSSGVITHVQSFEEDINSLDTEVIAFTYPIQDLISIEDELLTNFISIEEDIPIPDSVLLVITQNVEDLIVSEEDTPIISAFSPVMFDELSPTLDETPFITITQSIEEDLVSLDSTVPDTPAILVNDISGSKLSIEQYVNNLSTANVSIGIYVNDINNTDIEIMSNYLPAFVDVTSPDNIYEPTVSVYGTVLASNDSTNPGGTDLDKAPVYIHWLSTGISGNEWTDLFNFSFDLDNQGGRFSIASKTPLNVSDPNPNPTGLTSIGFTNNYFHSADQGPYVPITPIDELAVSNLGYEATVFGLKGTILDFGPTVSDSESAWISQGIFGSKLLNRNFNFLLFNSPLSSLLTTTGAGSLLNASDARSLAFQIAFICGITLTWVLPNIPIQNTFRLDGMTGAQAIANLSAQCGGTLRWDGNDNYIAAYPNQAFGIFEVPDSRLLTSAGLAYLQHMDLETGLTGTGLLMLPTPDKGLSGAQPLGTGAIPALQRITQLRQKLTSADPPVISDLPYNYDQVYIQILIPPGQSTGGINDISLNNFITTDPTEWFVFDTSLLHSPGVNTGYIFNAYLGNQYIPQVKLDYHCFPNVNDSVDNEHFTLSLACSTKSLQQAFIDSKNNLFDAAQAQLAAAFEATRFIKTYTGTITCQFFGSLPLPGMWGRATVVGGSTILTLSPSGDLVESKIPLSGDMVVEGVIESVQFTFPGTVTIQVAQYARINYGSTPMQNISVTGGLFI